MKFKGTKGKWYLQDFTDAYTNIIRCDDGKHQTLWIGSTGQSSIESVRYDALLMANSKNLLKMLQRVLNRIDDMFEEYGDEIPDGIEELLVPIMADAEDAIREATILKGKKIF